MRPSLRSLTFGFAAILAGAALGQYPYTIIAQGTVSNCYPGQTVTIQTVQNTQPAYDFEVPVDTSTCTWSATLGVSSNPAFFTASTFCNGMVVTAAGQAGFNFIQDTMVVSLTLVCSSGQPDCEGVDNGPNMPGTACDDGNPQTFNDTWTPSCICYGVGQDECWTQGVLVQSTNNGVPVPFEVVFEAVSSGALPITYSWYFGQPFVLAGTSTDPSWTHTFGPGEQLACNVIAVDADGCTSGWSNVEGSMSCDGMLGSPNWPGFPCLVPGTTLPGTWSQDCICVADSMNNDCQAGFTFEQTAPWTIATTNTSTGSVPLTYSWWLPDGGTSIAEDVTFTFNATGGYGICLNISDADGCSSWFCDTLFVDSIGNITDIVWVDCLGDTNGYALPGSYCDDGNPMTVGDVWDANCGCSGTPFVGVCSASFTMEQDAPWTVTATSTSTGTGPVDLNWSDGSTAAQTTYNFSGSGAGIQFICLDIIDSTGCSSFWCDTMALDTNGILLDNWWYDCMQVFNGPALPGTPCNDNDPNTINDTWGFWCTCVGDTTGSSCQASFTVTSNAPWTITATASATGAPPFSFSWWLPDGTPANGGTITYVFDTTGVYGLCLTITDAEGCTSSTCDTLAVASDGTVTDWNSTWYDCEGELNGPALPGTPCTIPGTILEGTWDADCQCVLNTTDPCNADFWVVQAYEGNDTTNTGTPIPYTLWVWNLSSGGTGAYQFLWNFGDGGTSTLPFPTHEYAGNGPYNLCLTLWDSNNCTDTYCDSVSINGDGLYEGMIVHGGASDRQDGFTINVLDPLTTSIGEQAVGGLTIWPNPVTEELYIALDGHTRGQVPVSVIDANGRTVMAVQRALVTGDNRFSLPTEQLEDGLYLLRIGTPDAPVTRRFIKTR